MTTRFTSLRAFWNLRIVQKTSNDFASLAEGSEASDMTLPALDLIDYSLRSVTVNSVWKPRVRRASYILASYNYLPGGHHSGQTCWRDTYVLRDMAKYCGRVETYGFVLFAQILVVSGRVSQDHKLDPDGSTGRSDLYAGAKILQPITVCSHT